MMWEKTRINLSLRTMTWIKNVRIYSVVVLLLLRVNRQTGKLLLSLSTALCTNFKQCLIYCPATFFSFLLLVSSREKLRLPRKVTSASRKEYVINQLTLWSASCVLFRVIFN